MASKKPIRTLQIEHVTHEFSLEAWYHLLPSCSEIYTAVHCGVCSEIKRRICPQLNLYYITLHYTHWRACKPSGPSPLKRHVLILSGRIPILNRTKKEKRPTLDKSKCEYFSRPYVSIKCVIPVYYDHADTSFLCNLTVNITWQCEYHMVSIL